VVINTNRLTLTPHHLKYNNELHAILGNAATMQYYPAPYSLEQCEAWIAKSKANFNESGTGMFAVLLKDTNEFIGQCGIQFLEIDGVTVPEIGYHINKSYWNKGYATEAAKACLAYGFNELNLREIFIHTYIKNIASQRVAEKLGMKKLKTYDKVLTNFGLVWPHVVYSMTEKDYDVI